MLKKFDIDDNEIITVCVIATMSSGKSTFLNAVFGEEILPEKNEACTAKALTVINVPGVRDTKAYIHKQDGKKYAVDLFYPNTVAKINLDENITDVLIVKDISSIQNTDRSVVFVDTPGINNSNDIRHFERTKEILDQLKKGVIVYLMNATQLATNDDELLLQMVINHIKNNSDVKVIFVLNKIDMLDEDRESILDIINTAKQYIKEHGLEDIKVFPLSALSAKTFRLKLNGKNMTKAEQRHMDQAYYEYQVLGKSMMQYVDLERTCYMIDGQNVSAYALHRAIENTGIAEIERQIEHCIISFVQKSPKKLDNLKNYAKLEGVYSRKRKTKNYVDYRGKIDWICKKCKQVNGSNQECLNCKNPRLKCLKLKD